MSDISKVQNNIMTKSPSGRNISMDVIQHPQVFRWLQELAKYDFRNFYKLTRPSRISLQKVLGKPNKKNNNLFIWFIKNYGMTWQISHHQKLGIEFRIIIEPNLPTQLSESYVYGTGMIQYLDSLLKALSSL